VVSWTDTPGAGVGLIKARGGRLTRAEFSGGFVERFGGGGPLSGGVPGVYPGDLTFKTMKLASVLFALALVLFQSACNKIHASNAAATPTPTVVPSGAILAWSPPAGWQGETPDGWILCDGGHAPAPNLLGRFLRGSESYQPNQVARLIPGSLIPQWNHMDTDDPGNLRGVVGPNSGNDLFQQGGGNVVGIPRPPYYTVVYLMKK
jgi:hypothetical protein